MSDRPGLDGWADDGDDEPRGRARDFAVEAVALSGEVQALVRSVEVATVSGGGDLTDLKARIDELAERYRALSLGLAREADRAGLKLTKH